MAIGIALLGAGIFAREEHLPAILANQSLFSLKAIYSRSQSSAEALASSGSSSPEASSSRPDVYYSVSSISSEHKKEGAKEGEGQGGEGISSDDKSLDALLSREDIKAVIVVLPILAQPGIIQKALSKGKHVLSEKPIAPDVDAGRGLISWYSSFSGVSGDGVEGGGGGGVERRKPLWAVAENFRFIPSLEYAAARLAEMGGELRTFRMEKWGLVRAGDKYFETEWRKNPNHQGGFLLDGGVHFVAALRLLLRAAGTGGGHEIKRLAGFSDLLEERLLPVDTVNAVAITDGGKTGSIAVSFGTEFKSGLLIEIVTTNGVVAWTPTSVKVVSKNAAGDKVEDTKEYVYDNGVSNEIVAFGKAIESGKLEERQMPLEALKDLEILQRLLESGRDDAALKGIEV